MVGNHSSGTVFRETHISLDENRLHGMDSPILAERSCKSPCYMYCQIFNQSAKAGR